MLFLPLCVGNSALANDAIPTAGFTYHFGAKMQQPIVEAYLGYNIKPSYGNAKASPTATKLLSWNYAGYSDSNFLLGGVSVSARENIKNGLSTMQKVGIGFGIVVGLAFLLPELAEDSIGDAIDRKAKENTEENVNDPPENQNTSEPLCTSIGGLC